MEQIIFVMPAYNEQDNIQALVSQWMPVVHYVNQQPGYCARMVIADDGSTDYTCTILEQLQPEYPLLTVLHKTNSGHGSTLLYLYNYAIEQGATYVFQTDSDGQTDPSDFYLFFEQLHNYDIQIGQRIHREDGWGRIVVSKVLLILLYIIFHVRLKDANAPFRLMRADHLKQMLKMIPADFFLSNVLISVIAAKKQLSMAYHPITFRPRQGGVNSINYRRIFRIGGKALIDFRRFKSKLSRPATLYVRLNNRLGNQMFQYAFARAAMSQMKLSQCYLVGQEESRLGCFAIKEGIQYKDTISELPFQTRFAAQFMGKMAALLSNHPSFLYKSERFLQPIINYCGVYFCLDGYLPFRDKKLRGEKIYCSGYFQSEKYYKDCIEQIRQDFTFSGDIIQSCQSFATQILSCHAVCLHIRQGDYLTSPRHLVCDAGYYQLAISQMLDRHPDAHFFLFSDDPSRALQLILESSIPNTPITVVPTSFSDQQTLYLGTLCRHHILSNSTFSWWMQYLAHHKDQMVIAPRRWLNDSTPVALYDPSWQIL